MHKTAFTILQNAPVARGVYMLRLGGDTSAITAPGQFVEASLPGHFLRRPFSVSDWEPGELTLIYRLSGGGTQAMSALGPGTTLELLTGLGNGFDAAAAGPAPLLIGGGTGVSPLYGLAKRLLREGKRPAALLGYADRDGEFMAERFEGLGIPVTVVTVDGSLGKQGMVTDHMPEGEYSAVFSCGPEAMLRALREKANAPCFFSLEARMGCGFGACMGCTIETKNGPKRVCRDGPVFAGEELIW